MNQAQHAELIQHQLESLRDSIRLSVNHKDRSDSSYPVASKRFNEAVAQLIKLAESMPPVKELLASISRYDEKNFLLHGNYEYAVRLLIEIEQIIPIAESLFKSFSKKQKVVPKFISLPPRYKEKIFSNIDNTARGYQAVNPDIKKQDGANLIRQGCGLLNESECRQKAHIKAHFSSKRVFFDIPYTEEYSEQEKILREIMDCAGLDLVVAKDKITSSDKLCKICRLLQTCRYGVADISGNRHSVSYELGLLHAFGLPTCILMDKDQTKFGDIDGLEHQSYSGTASLKIALARWLLDNVREADKTRLDKLTKANKKALSREKKFRKMSSVGEQKHLSRLQAFKSFLDAQIVALKKFTRSKKKDFSKINSWHHSFEKMITEALGKEIKNSDVKTSLHMLESKIDGMVFYGEKTSISQIQEALDLCKYSVEQIRDQVTSHDLADHFDPRNLV